MDKKKIIYIVVLFTVTLFVSVTYFSYAFFIKDYEYHGKINIIAGTLDYKIESKDLNSNDSLVVSANDYKEIEVEISSLNSIDSLYKLFYTSTGNVIIGYDQSNDSSSGMVAALSQKNVKVIIFNLTNSDVTVTLGVQGGLLNNELVLATGTIIGEAENISAPVIAGGTGDRWVKTTPTITVSTVGVAGNGVSNYEYLRTASSSLPTYQTAATGTTSGSITVSDEGTTYVYYRTVSNSGLKSRWSNQEIVNLDTTGVKVVTQAAEDYYSNNSITATTSFTLPASNATLGINDNTLTGTVYIRKDGEVAFQGLNNNKCLVERYESNKVEQLLDINNNCSKPIYKNLIVNGYGEYGNNTNFTTLTYDSSNNEFYRTVNSDSQSFPDLLIPIDTSKKYKYSMDAYSDVGTATFLGLVEYDIDRLSIVAYHILYLNNTLATLTQDLNDGDTVVHLDDLSNWNNTTTVGYRAGFIFWNYKDSTGYQYPELTYSRNQFSVSGQTDPNKFLFNPANIDKTNNTITLNKPWSNGFFPQGTKVSQTDSGAAYNYSLVAGDNLNSSYTTYTRQLTGINNNATTVTKFRHGTKYIRPLLWLNYRNAVSTDVTYHFKNIIFEIVD